MAMQVEDLMLRFSYRHFQTDGKLENMFEAMDEIEGWEVYLGFGDVVLDGEMLDRSEVDKRLGRIKKVVGKLRWRGYRGHLVLPGLGGRRGNDDKYKKYVKYLYGKAGGTGVKKILVDDAGFSGEKKQSKRDILNWFGAVGRAVHKDYPQIEIGLIGAELSCYAKVGVTAREIADKLSGKDHCPIIILGQGFGQDDCRTGILEAVANIAAAKAMSGTGDDVELLGAIDCSWSDGFHKSAEATQMQVNLNLLHGLGEIVLNCFDQTGTAPGDDNIYLQMHQNTQKFRKKLCGYMPEGAVHGGVRIILPDGGGAGKNGKAFSNCNCWAMMLWRMGMPATFVGASGIRTGDDANGVYVLTGKTPGQLSRRQLNHVFQNGVLLDAEAAETIERMGLPGLIGVKVGGGLSNVQTEILSDQAFAAPYYSYQTVWGDKLGKDDFRRLEPFHDNCRVVTSLARKGKLPNTNGMVLFDNSKHNHRCAILPYSLTSENYGGLLSTQRQRHTRDIISWLLRRRLCCFVENTADLVPFFVPAGKRRKIVLALLNIGFDWAIDARVRLGTLPFRVKQVRELNEQGKLVFHRDLQVTTHRDYQHLQLTSDTAVPPMQMTVLLLEG